MEGTREIAREAAREAVREVLPEVIREMMLTLGVNISTPEGVQETQRNFVFLNDLRVGADHIKRKTFLTIVGTLVAGALAYMAIGFRPH